MADSPKELNIPPIPPLPEIPKVKLDYRFGSENPKNPADYQIGDDLVDYFPLTKGESPPPLPSAFYEELDKAFESLRDSFKAEIAFMDALIEYQKSSLDVLMASARYSFAEAKTEGIRNRRLKFKASILGSQPQSSGESTPDPSRSESEFRRDRLAGVDVSKLPAGFGKRRASGGGAAAKRPKTPTEEAPELKEPTPTATP